jgi:ribose-phosphate pyrophosphokinase
LGIRCAITSKHRPKPEQAEVTDIIGRFEGISQVLILDDMINTGGTVEAAIKKINEKKEIQEIWLGVSHFLGSLKAVERLRNLHQNFNLKGIYVTDSVPLTSGFTKLDFTQVVSIDQLLSETIISIHRNTDIELALH